MAPKKLQDRSGHILEQGMKVRVISDLELFTQIMKGCDECNDSNLSSSDLFADVPNFLGCEGTICSIDTDDGTVQLEFSRTSTNWWLPVLALEASNSAKNTKASDVTGTTTPALDLCESMFDNPEFMDATIKTADGEVQAHKCVLVAASSVFARMFAGPMKESSSGVVELLDCKQRTLRVLLRLLYTGHIDSTDWNPTDKANTEDMPLDIVLDVLKLAKRYMIDTVTRSSIEEVKTRLANANQDPGIIETILAEAIAADLGAVRMAAMKAAESNSQLRKMYDEGALRPEVIAELQALWPFSEAPKKKRRRFGAVAM